MSAPLTGRRSSRVAFRGPQEVRSTSWGEKPGPAAALNRWRQDASLAALGRNGSRSLASFASGSPGDG